MLNILERIDADSSYIGLMVELFNTLRPKRPNDGARATANVRTLCQLLKGDPAHALALRGYARNLIASRRHSSLYTEIGVLSNDGFFTELKTRIARECPAGRCRCGLWPEIAPAARCVSACLGVAFLASDRVMSVSIMAITEPLADENSMTARTRHHFFQAVCQHPACRSAIRP